jgi:uncharacterized membrane protein
VNELAIVRALHVLAVVIWIGGVAFVTTVLLPVIRRSYAPVERFAAFNRLEHRFASQARVTTLVTGVTGLWMTQRWGLWSRFAEAGFWWMHAMVVTWIAFTLLLFVLEPLALHRWLEQRAAHDAEGTFALLERLHRILLALSAITVLGAVAGAHGWV